ncbi:dTDP-4-dehydrorhamnose 3,5-epimerase [bacterium]
MPFHFQKLNIPDVILIEPKVFEDNRGYFMESYKQTDFIVNEISEHFIQDNISLSSKNVIRGLHFQTPPHAQGKLVMALQGEIFDVAVDIRQNSPTYGNWISKNLSQTNQYMLYIPPGFAHGFCVISDHAKVMYKCTAEYAPQCDQGIFWNDPAINIDWPVKNPLLSDKDLALPLLNKTKNLF